MIENTPTTIPAMTGLLRCCDEWGDAPDPTDEGVADEVADKVGETEDELGDSNNELDAAADEVGAAELVSPLVDGAAVSEVVGEVVGVN